MTSHQAVDTYFSLAGKRVWVAGHQGMVGRAIVRALQAENCTLLTCPRNEADLRRQVETEAWIEKNQPQVIFLAAAKVGGILANDTQPAEFLYDNLAIETSVIEAARRFGVAKLVLLGSACIYPRLAPQPIPESALLQGPLEPTNQWYSIAKIAGLKLVQAYRRQYGLDFISVMPTNLYGPYDNFDLQTSHVVPALLRKIHVARRQNAPTVEIWGTGRPRREFMHVDDCAQAIIQVTQQYSGEEPINIGVGSDISIADLTAKIAHAVGYTGRFEFNASLPDGMPRRLLNCDRLISLGWRPTIDLDHGLATTYAWFCQHHGEPQAQASRYPAP
jgi:GDP-L-fucose synthase